MPSHNDTEHSRAQAINLLSARLGTSRRVLAENRTLSSGSPLAHFYNPNGANRTITLPAIQRGGGEIFFFSNIGTADNIIVQSEAAVTVETFLPGHSGFVIASESEWTSVGVEDVFGPSGAGHSSGLVPDPGAAAGDTRYLNEDGTWKTISFVGSIDSYKTITDGTNSSLASGYTTFKFRSSSGKISAVVTDNDATHGDNLDLSVVEASVDHNALLNYVADQHVAHAGVSISAGIGLTGGGTIAATRTLALSIDGLVSEPVALTDSFAFYDLSLTTHKKDTFTSLNAVLDHNALTNYVADRHVDHTTVSMQAGIGLSGGGDLSATRTFALDFTELQTGQAIVAADLIPFYDASELDHNTTTFALFNDALDHNALLNYVANRHIDHTAVSISTTGALTGGGDISATRTLSVLANGITDAMLRQGAALSVIGRSANLLGDVADIVAAADGEVLRRSGTTLGFGKIATAGVSDDAVTNALLANMATQTIKGRTTAGTGDPEDLTDSQVRTLLGLVIGTNVQAWDAQLDDLALLAPTKGRLIVGDGTNWQPIGVGTNSHVLTADSVQGLGIKWAAAPGAGGGLADAYQQITDGTTTAAAAAGDTIKFRADTGVTAVVGSNDATHGDNLLIGLHASISALASITSAADFLPYYTGSGTAAGTAFTSSGRALVGLTGATDVLPYFTGAGAAATSAFTGVARTLVGQTTQALMRTTGLGITTTGDSLATAASAAAAATTIGVGTGDSPQFTAINVGHASDTTITRDSAGVIAVEGVPIFSNIPQNSKSAAYTTVLADAQKHIFHPSADTTARTFTIDSNANVAYPIGTAITFINQNAGGVVTIAITTDTMRLAGPGTTGSRTLASNGIATAIKVTTTEWIISGTGLT